MDSRPIPPIEPANNETIKYNNFQSRILHISDIHLDTQYLEGSINTCDDIICCHRENGMAEKVSLAAGYYGDYKCDTPTPLLDQTIKFIKNTHPDLKLLLVTGDMSAHNEWAKSIESNVNITGIVKKKLAELGVDIVFSLGNNECFPDHQFDPDHENQLKAGIAKVFDDYLT